MVKIQFMRNGMRRDFRCESNCTVRKALELVGITEIDGRVCVDGRAIRYDEFDKTLCELSGSDSCFLTYIEETEPVRITVRYSNRGRETIEFFDNSEILEWAQNVLSENDKILIVSKGNLCLYSALSDSFYCHAQDLIDVFG